MTKSRNKLIEAALNCARDKMYALMTREDVAEYASVAPSLVSHYLGSMDAVRDAVMNRAVEIEDHHILAQGIVFKHPALKRVPTEVRHRIISTLKSEGYDTNV